MPQFCQVLAGAIAAASLAWVAVAESALRRPYKPDTDGLLLVVWLPAVMFPAMRAASPRFGGQNAWVVWGGVIYSAAVSIAWATWRAAEFGTSGAGTAEITVSAGWFVALLAGAAGLLLDRPARPADDDAED